ncbi:ABC transporter ATP-binding protein [Rhodococcus sp. 15-725-2-2b]|uniref:ABC transporter ATP-binding protein n=1 Tax=unclassified Rhodococcus (in: high G+C Gram-positive bacteria) TaxID=192944 RepID=UPI000B9C4EF2|nr:MULTISPECIES: ABC transporter ATP-binding protein [unclassified Rhodococcus (in: high G+C Gram-positive bacteria)]OZC72204.1 ABC transporter ATP-binding protein [Rhodococcus sp. 06-469-3-2]OZD39611.1 ABC transporter ATP-binding protein [Rhodococcus sp. 06-1477-1A]OZE68622.1 ABC transporter ATP-binding protein [Rhodococcus sp. 15-725-2-2b]
MAAIDVRDITQRYRGRTAVKGVSLAIAEGETHGLLGRNGAGKTTLVEIVAGLRKPSSGSVRVLGLDSVADRDRVRAVLGVQLQSNDLHASLTVAELVDLFASFYRRPADRGALVRAVGLHEHRRVRYEHLSGGQQQRLSVVLALIGSPRVVVLDELTTGLDPDARRTVWRLIEDLRADGVTILLVSHHMDEVHRLCDRITVLDRGAVVATGTPESLIADAGLGGDHRATLEDAFLTLMERHSA